MNWVHVHQKRHNLVCRQNQLGRTAKAEQMAWSLFHIRSLCLGLKQSDPLCLLFIRFVYFQTSYSLCCSHRTELLYLGFDYTWIGGTLTRCYKSSYSRIPRSFRFRQHMGRDKALCVLNPLLHKSIKIKRNLMSTQGI